MDKTNRMTKDSLSLVYCYCQLDSFELMNSSFRQIFICLLSFPTTIATSLFTSFYFWHFTLRDIMPNWESHKVIIISNTLLDVCRQDFSKRANIFVTKNNISKLPIQTTIQWFGKEISQHWQSWTMSNVNSQSLVMILNPKIIWCRYVLTFVQQTYAHLFPFE